MVHSLAAHGAHVWASHGGKLYRLASADLERQQESDADLSLLTLNEDGARLLGLVAASKRVAVLDSRDLGAPELAAHEFPKRPSGIAVSGEELVVADKFGDVFRRALLCSSAANASEPILGHVSMVLAVAFASPRRVVTSDRDEHVRVSRFPQSFVIDRFLLGHESYVSHLLVDGATLLTAGGDSYVLAWNWQTGELLARCDVPGNVIALAGHNSGSGGGRAAIAVEGGSEVLEVSVPDLVVLNRYDAGAPVQALALTADRIFVALPDAVVALGAAGQRARASFEEPDTELVSEKHLKKRRDIAGETSDAEDANSCT